VAAFFASRFDDAATAVGILAQMGGRRDRAWDAECRGKSKAAEINADEPR
jgi:hypothetical protein